MRACIFLRNVFTVISKSVVIIKPLYINSACVSSHPLDPRETSRPLSGPGPVGSVASGAVCRSSSNAVYTLSYPGTYSIRAYLSSLSGGGRSMVGP